MYLGILRSNRYTTEEELQDYLEKIDAKAHHMKQLSDHLFEYALSKTSEARKEPQQMRDVFAEGMNHFIDGLR